MLLFLESVGTGEIVIIFLFILIFFGADKIPGIARNLGRGIRQIKDVTHDLQDEIRKTTTEIQREANMNREQFNDVKKQIESPVMEFTKDLKDSGTEINNNIEREKQQDSKPKELTNQSKPPEKLVVKDMRVSAPEMKEAPLPIAKRDQQNVD